MRVFLLIKVQRVQISMGMDTMIPVLVPLTCRYQKYPYPRVVDIYF